MLSHMLMVFLAARGGLTDEEIDAIAARHAWPTTEVEDKVRGIITARGKVPPEAAKEVFATLMAKHGLANTAKEGFDWYNSEMEAGFVYGATRDTRARLAVVGEVECNAAGTVGRGVDLAAARRQALRVVEAVGEKLLLDLAQEATGKKEPSDLAAVMGGIARVDQARQRFGDAGRAYRESLRRMSEDPSVTDETIASTIRELREKMREAERELAVRREELHKLVTPREEVRLILRGVLE